MTIGLVVSLFIGGLISRRIEQATSVVGQVAKGDLSSLNGLGEIDAVQAEIAKILG